MIICSFLETSMSFDRDCCSLHFFIQRQPSPMVCEDHHDHLLSLFQDYQSPLSTQRQASLMVCGGDDGHPFLIVSFLRFIAVPFATQRQASPMASGDRPWSFIVLKIIEVSPAIPRQSSPMACGDHHSHLFLIAFKVPRLC